MRHHKRKIQQLEKQAGLEPWKLEIKALIETGRFTIADVIAEFDEALARDIFSGPSWAPYWEGKG